MTRLLLLLLLSGCKELKTPAHANPDAEGQPRCFGLPRMGDPGSSFEEIRMKAEDLCCKEFEWVTENGRQTCRILYCQSKSTAFSRTGGPTTLYCRDNL